MSLNLPYFLNPVDPAEFVGREDILDALIASLKNERSNSVYDIELLGPIGLGKTSTLLKIRSMATDYLTVYISSIKCDENKFMDHLLQNIEREARSRDGMCISFMDLSASLRLGNTSGDSAFIDALSRLPDKKVLILLDDAHNFSVEALIALKSAVNQLRLLGDGHVRLILASTHPLTERLVKSGMSQSAAFLFSLELKNLSFQEAAILLTRLYPKWTKKSLDIAYSRTDGHPALTQMYSQAYHKLASSDQMLELFDVPSPKAPDSHSDWTALGEYVLDISKKVGFVQVSFEIISKCHQLVRNSALRWYESSWLQKPSSAELKVVLVIAKLGGSAKFKDIEKGYGKNPAPQLQRASEKGLIEHRSRGRYALPHELLAEPLLDRYLKKKAAKN